MVVQLIQNLVWILVSGESMDPLKPFEWILMIIVQLATNAVQMVSLCVYKTNVRFWKWKFWMVSNGLSVGGLKRNTGPLLNFQDFFTFVKLQPWDSVQWFLKAIYNFSPKDFIKNSSILKRIKWYISKCHGVSMMNVGSNPGPDHGTCVLEQGTVMYSASLHPGV